MSKRNLTRRQAWRIDKIQKEREARSSKRDDTTQSNLNESDLGPEQDGLIVTHYGTQVMVEDPITSELRRCHFRSNLGSLVTGDQVIWRSGNPIGVVVAIRDRDTTLLRPDAYGNMKVVAANIDRIAIVVAPYPEPHFHLIDRYLVAAEAIGIEPALVINKMDLVDDVTSAKIQAINTLYLSLGYSVLQASATDEQGLQAIKSYLTDFTSIFVGQSGVGKSSLVNALLDTDIKVGGLSTRQTGTHTTTSAQLYHIPSGGDLIDSPGIREFGLWHIEANEILAGFKEFRPFIGYCKFRDCSHVAEPQCAILAALADNLVSQQRLDSYRRMLTDLNPKASHY